GQCNTTDWKDIVDISVSYGHVLGLSKNGTIVATGWNEYGQCNVIELNEQK
ncbi:MAG: chromosome condensation regulator, partial [Elusimicrobia bacterium]|nr:chromosome condensation regulator [Elusimicrobiota bacterium]